MVERLADVDPSFVARLGEDRSVRDALVAVAGASRSLGDLCVADSKARHVLLDLDRRPPLEEELPRWKRLELLRIAARDLTGRDELPAVGRALARLAEGVVAAASEMVGVEGLAVIGMGKLGGSELNYSSDIDVMLVGAGGSTTSDAPRARSFLRVVRECFHVDVDLRPEGRDGPLVRSLESFEAYWERWAQTWEFQALIKARPVGGDEALGRDFAEAAARRLWTRNFTSEDLRSVRAMKARSEAELARKGLSDREVKRGRGGIRDIEFSVQLLQLVHGGSDPALRSPTTLDALDELASAGYIDEADSRSLDHSYRLLRTVEHRLQLVREQQVHTLPADPAAQERLARVMGYRPSPSAGAGALLSAYLSRQQGLVRAIHEHLFFRPLLDALTAAGAEHAMPAEAVAGRLVAFGFTNATRTRQALNELTRGLTRRSRLMQQMLPLLLGWLSESPDPDLGLLGLRVLTSRSQQATELAIAFRESPEAARRLCHLLGTSRRAGEIIEHHPDLIPSLGHDRTLAARSGDELRTAAATILSWRDSPDDRHRGLFNFKRREELMIAARDILGLTPDDSVMTAGRQLTDLAEACLAAAVDSVRGDPALAVVAMGRFGGGELSYASDLDLMFVHGGSNPAAAARADKMVEAVVRLLGGSVPAVALYAVDLGLRPEGKDGPLARSLEGYRSYYGRWAQTWERQALVRARVVAGDADLGRRFMDLIDAYLWGGGGGGGAGTSGDNLGEEEIRAIRRMKARVERERIGPGEDPQFHLKLGRGSLSDVEFCVQLLQLRHRVASPGTMAAIDALQATAVLDPADGQVLAEAYRFCEMARNRWFLIKGSAADSLPSQPQQLARLAHSLDTTSTQLREDYRRVTRRCRAVVERLFYGRTIE